MMRLAAISFLGLVFLICYGSRIDWHNPDVDFAPFYSAARVGPSEYLHADAMRAENAKLGAVLNARLYVPRPPVFVALMRPLARLPFRSAILLWRIICVLSIIGAVVIWSRWGRSIYTALAWSVPALWSVYNGQDGSLWLLATSASLVIPNPWMAGAVLGFAVFKWHLFVFIAPVLVAKSEWERLGAASATVAALIGASFALCPDWFPRLLAVLRNPEMHPYFDKSPGLRSLFVASPMTFTALMLLTVVLLFVAAKRLPLHVSVALALAAGCIVNAHSYAVDCTLLLPLAVLAIPAPVKGFLFCPLPYLALLFSIPMLLWVGLATALISASIPLRTDRQQGHSPQPFPSAQSRSDAVPSSVAPV